ncbi:MAG: hypothetical protein V4529_16830 [Gemmatimonadota bacterium]
MTAAERIRLARETLEALIALREGLEPSPAAADVYFAKTEGLRDALAIVASAAAVRSSVERGDALAVFRTSTELEGS